MALGQMALDLKRKVSRLVLKMRGHSTLPNCCCIQGVNQFVYFRSVVSVYRNSELNIARRINSAIFTFAAFSASRECGYVGVVDTLRPIKAQLAAIRLDLNRN